jgi:alpha-D-xyloside xylohydrolase
MPLDALNLELRNHYFGGGGGNGPNDGGRGPHNDALLVTAAEGKTLLHMRTWRMEPESAEVAENDTGVKGYRVSSMFDSPEDEHYYGLGQQQKGWMDLRDHEIRCWHDYVAIGGQDVCVPFMVSSRGYGLVWDNPSKTTVDLGFNGRNRVVVGGWRPGLVFRDRRRHQRRDLRGLPSAHRRTHMLPRAIYGYIQSKAIYPTQDRFWMWPRSIARRNCRWMWWWSTS